MITLELPPITTWHEPILKPDESRITKALNMAELDQLTGWISLGEPIVLPITSKLVPEDDMALRQFLELNDASYKFFLIQLACTFKPPQDEWFKQAWMAVNLVREDNSPESQPIAWDMQPKLVAQPVEISSTVKLNASLKLAEIFLGAQAGVEQEKKWTESQIFLEALNELQSDPVWEFSRTVTAQIRGLHRFHLVVRAPRGAVTSGTVNLSATVERKRFLFITYQTNFSDAPQLTFRLP